MHYKGMFKNPILELSFNPGEMVHYITTECNTKGTKYLITSTLIFAGRGQCLDQLVRL